MSKGRLTRQELSWLLTQEAQHAAERLRAGVQILRTQAPPAPPGDEPHDPAHHVDASLDALDDVMKMLSNLNLRAPAAGAGPRRGRIDLAALLVEIAPESPLQIEPGSGTEIYGDEADIRRMLQVIVGHGSGAGAPIAVRRDGDEVKVSITLGPDTSPTAETERAWLSRMATRYGGRHELEGGNEVVAFPADGASERSEREALKKELDEVRRQSEVYARELAAMFDRGEEVTTGSTIPPALGLAKPDRLAMLTKACAGIAAELEAAFGSAAHDVAGMRRHDVTEEQLETLRHRFARTREIVGFIAAVGAVRPTELAAEVDLVALARSAAGEVAAQAEREGVAVKLREGAGVRVRRAPKALATLARQLVAHAVSASPRGSTVELGVEVGGPAGPRLVVDDGGPPLPASARRAFLTLETHPAAYGRPSGLPIFLCAEIAACQGASLELADSPQGGLRVGVTFAER